MFFIVAWFFLVKCYSFINSIPLQVQPMNVALYCCFSASASLSAHQMTVATVILKQKRHIKILRTTLLTELGMNGSCGLVVSELKYMNLWVTKPTLNLAQSKAAVFANTCSNTVFILFVIMRSCSFKWRADPVSSVYMIREVTGAWQAGIGLFQACGLVSNMAATRTRSLLVFRRTTPSRLTCGERNWP